MRNTGICTGFVDSKAGVSSSNIVAVTWKPYAEDSKTIFAVHDTSNMLTPLCTGLLFSNLPAAAAGDPPWLLMADGAMDFPGLELENWHPRPNYGFANGLPPLRRMSNRLGAGQSEENKLATFCSPTCCSQYENLIAGHQNPTKSQARA